MTMGSKKILFTLIFNSYLAHVLSLAYVKEICGLNEYKFVDEVGGYVKLNMIPTTWTDAVSQCGEDGGVMISPIKTELRALMNDVIKSYKLPGGIFTGFNARYKNGSYESLEGISLSNVDDCNLWEQGEPDNKSYNENCLAMNSNGLLVDISCDEKRPYLCYKKSSLDDPCGTAEKYYKLSSITGKCYKFYRWANTWKNAYDDCDRVGGRLLVINSDEESEVIKKLIEDNPVSTYEYATTTSWIWVGYWYWHQRKIWATVKGQTLQDAGYENWIKGEPNNEKNNEFCGAINRNAELNDSICSYSYAYICEKDPWYKEPTSNW